MESNRVLWSETSGLTRTFTLQACRGMWESCATHRIEASSILSQLSVEGPPLWLFPISAGKFEAYADRMWSDRIEFEWDAMSSDVQCQTLDFSGFSWVEDKSHQRLEHAKTLCLYRDLASHGCHVQNLCRTSSEKRVWFRFRLDHCTSRELMPGWLPDTLHCGTRPSDGPLAVSTA